MNIYWIGARQIDIEENNLFVGSITRYGNDNNNNCSFCDNTLTENYHEFVNHKLNDIIANDDEAYFMFANEYNAYQYGKKVFEKSICVNPLYIIESMNDKIFARNFFSDCVKTPNSILVNSAFCSNYSFIKEIFNNKYSEFVLQEASGAGGMQNYFLEKENILDITPKTSHILVTPYFSNTLTANVHIVVGKNCYKILPPSLQITVNKFRYSGSDFIAFNSLSLQTKNNVISCAKKIAKKVMSLNAMGIFGIDLLISNDNILFLECNYRYQGSSFVLNKGLIESGYPSLFKMRYNSFYENLEEIPDDIYKVPIVYSSFRRTQNNKSIELPYPFETIAINDSPFASNDQYIQYELYTRSIIENIAKQEVQNLC